MHQKKLSNLLNRFGNSLQPSLIRYKNSSMYILYQLIHDLSIFLYYMELIELIWESSSGWNWIGDQLPEISSYPIVHLSLLWIFSCGQQLQFIGRYLPWIELSSKHRLESFGHDGVYFTFAPEVLAFSNCQERPFGTASLSSTIFMTCVSKSIKDRRFWETNSPCRHFRGRVMKYQNDWILV